MKSFSLKLLAAPLNLLASLAIASLVLLPLSTPPVYAAASTQTTHAVLCAPDSAVGVPGPRQVVNTSSTAATKPTYTLNSAGCAVIAGADIGFFLSQGFSYGPNTFTLQATGVTGSGTASVSTLQTLPAYGYIMGFILCETAGNAVTGGLNIGDSGSATRFGSAVALGANACVVVADSALTRIVVLSGVPTASTILLAAVTSWNSAVVNVTVIYGYF